MHRLKETPPAYQQIVHAMTNPSDTKAIHAQDVLAMYEKLAHCRLLNY